MGEKNKSINCIVVLRAIFAVLVMLAHANLIIDRNLFHGIFIQGWCGVDFFFVLSGFLVGYLYWDKTTSIIQYLKKRAIRIFPTYLVYNAIVITFHFALNNTGGGICFVDRYGFHRHCKIVTIAPYRCIC